MWHSKTGSTPSSTAQSPDDEILRLFRERGAFLCTTISPALPYALFDRSVSNASEVEQFNGNVVFEGIIECAKAALAHDIPSCWATTSAAMDHAV